MVVTIENIAGVLIVIMVLGGCFLLVYWSFNLLYEGFQKSKVNRNDPLKNELIHLKQRMESLEKKIENK
jgi:hypothetical protein